MHKRLGQELPKSWVFLENFMESLSPWLRTPADAALLTAGGDCVWEPQSIYRKFVENALSTQLRSHCSHIASTAGERLGCLCSVAGNQRLEGLDVIFSATWEVLKTVFAMQDKTVETPVSLDLEIKTLTWETTGLSLPRAILCFVIGIKRTNKSNLF